MQSYDVTRDLDVIIEDLQTSDRLADELYLMHWIRQEGLQRPTLARRLLFEASEERSKHGALFAFCQYLKRITS